MEQLESDIDNLQEENVEDFAGYEKISEIKAAYNAATCKAPMSGEKDIILKLLVMPTNNKAAKAERDSFVKEHPEVFGDWNKIGKADINRRIKEIESYHPLLPDTLEIFRKYIDLNDDLSTVKAELKAKTIALTEAVVAKYAALTEDEIKTLVVERKWLANVVGGCEALMQNVTHQIASDVTTLAERYEVTLGATESKVNDLEQEVLRSLKEMGFTL